MHKRLAVVLILIFALFGLADSAYLAMSERTGAPLLCDLDNFSGCNIVAASPYSDLFGIPLADYGVLFYSILAVLAVLELVVFDRLLRRMLQAISIVGILASIYFTFVQAVYIKAFCIYCLASALFAFLIFLLATGLEPLRRTALDPEPAPPAP